MDPSTGGNHALGTARSYGNATKSTVQVGPSTRTPPSITLYLPYYLIDLPAY